MGGKDGSGGSLDILPVDSVDRCLTGACGEYQTFETFHGHEDDGSIQVGSLKLKGGHAQMPSCGARAHASALWLYRFLQVPFVQKRIIRAANVAQSRFSVADGSSLSRWSHWRAL